MRLVVRKRKCNREEKNKSDCRFKVTTQSGVRKGVESINDEDKAQEKRQRRVED